MGTVMSGLTQIEEHMACDVCHRTMLKGEWAEPYLTPSRERRLVCELCAPHAQREGWIRESAAPHAPAQPQRPPERRGLFRRLARRREAGSTFAESEPFEREPESGVTRRDEHVDSTGPEHTPEEPVFTRLRNRAAGPRKPRHVRAVPTNAQLKIDRALDLFNRSEHPRTIAGIARSLGPPGASALTRADSPAEVVLTVAWELSWYQFTVDLSDAREPVQVRAQGQELKELADETRAWNLDVDADGKLAPPTGESTPAGEPVPAAASAPESGGEALS
jgi:hypothetical protein